MGERESVSHFLLLITQQPLGGFSSNLARIRSSPGKLEKSPDQKHVFKKGCVCPDDNLKSASHIHMEFGK